jgi:hypothetical protein
LDSVLHRQAADTINRAGTRERGRRQLEGREMGDGNLGALGGWTQWFADVIWG